MFVVSEKKFNTFLWFLFKCFSSSVLFNVLLYQTTSRKIAKNHKKLLKSPFEVEKLHAMKIYSCQNDDKLFTLNLQV